MELINILDQLDDFIYISDVETYDLLFVNKALKEKFQIASYENKKCYELIMGNSSPCDICTNSKLVQNVPYRWTICNPLIQRQAHLTDMLVDYRGRKARLEFARDITDEELNSTKLKQALDMEKLTIDCVKIMYNAANSMESISMILSKLGNFSNADRAYIFEIRDTLMNNTYEWCAENVTPQIEFCQNMDISLMDMWRQSFSKGKSVILKNISEIKESDPKSYEALAIQNIQSIVASPIIINGKLHSYIGVDNPDLDQADYMGILDTLSYFLSISLEHMQMNKTLVYSSYHDVLTGLFNRNKFVEDTDVLSDQPEKSAAIIYIDINGLKSLNDRFGHKYGDQILIEGAQILQDVFSSEKIYRVGGDEFVILDLDTTEKQVNNQVEVLKKRFISSVDCKAAVGFEWADSCRDLEKKINRADEKMYRDKMHYYREHPSTNRYRSYNDNTLKLADEKNLAAALGNKQFEIYLQPKVEFESFNVIGAEALIRYHDETGTLVAPDQFIPAMEDARTIHYIDFFVLNTVCQLIARWISENKKVCPISVNFSRYTLMLPDFINKLLRIWGHYNIPKTLIEIEIVERTETVDSSALLAIMKKIKDAGFPVCIDDFGVKYSNMSLFVSADLDVLKLDRSMMAGIVENNKAQLLIGSLSQICRNLGIQFIIEGVETKEQFDLLKSLNCDGAQGYYISRPIPISKYETSFF